MYNTQHFFFLVIIGNQTVIADFEAHEHKEIQKWNVKTYILKYLPWRRSKTKITDCFLSAEKKIFILFLDDA